MYTKLFFQRCTQYKGYRAASLCVTDKEQFAEYLFSSDK